MPPIGPCIYLIEKAFLLLGHNKAFFQKTVLKKIKQLGQHAGFMRYFKNTSWLLGERILRMGVGLFIGIWIARYLGPEQFGLLSYAQSFVFLFTAIATLGLDGIVVRELVKDESKRDVLLGTAFALKLIGAIIILPVLYLAIQFTNNDDYTNLLVFIIASATIFQSFNVIDFYYQSKVLSKYVALANTVVLALSSVIKIALLLYEAPLLAFAFMTVFDGLVLAVGLVYFYVIKNHFKLINWHFDMQEARSLLHASWPLMFSGLVLMVQARVDQVMIKEMLGAVEVGFYSVAMKLIEVFGVIPVVLSTSLFPSIQKTKNHSIELYQERLLNFYRLNFLIFVVVAVPLFVVSEPLVVLLFGIEYQAAGVLLALMAVRLLFTNMGVARSAYIMTENLMQHSLFTMILGTMTNIFLNYKWIPELGVKGAVLSTIVSFFVSVFLIDVFYPKTRRNVLMQFRSMITFHKIKM